MHGAVAALAAALVAPPAAASGVEISWSADVPATVTALSAWLVLEGTMEGSVGSRCGICSGPGRVDRWFRSWLLGRDPGAASIASDAMLGGVAGLVSLSEILIVRLGGEPWMDLAEDLMLVTEAVATTAFVTVGIKISVRRTRPYAFFGAGDPLYDEGSRDVTGFPSLHTSLAFALAASAATVSFLRHRPAAPWIAASGAILALATGTLRIVADRHYFSDVAAGLLIGAAVGVLVPLVHALPLGGARVSIAIAPAPGGAGVAGVF